MQADQGWCRLYSREGPRLTPPATEGGEEQGGEQGKTNEEMGNVEAAGSGDTLIDLEEGMNIGRGMDAEGAGGEKGIAEAVGEVRGLLGKNTKGDVEERSRGDDDRDGEGVEEMETAEKSTAVGHAEVEKSEKSESKAGGGGMDLIM